MRRYITDAQHDAGVTMPAVFYHGDVDVDDIAAFQPLRVRGNAMANDFVDRGADRLWEPFVVERGRDGFLHVDDVVMADAINLARCHAHLDAGCNHV